jgi:ABC-2 type transport system ATP-binding protein
MIEVRGLQKVYKVHEREAGFWSSVRSLFDRKFRDVYAVDDVSFSIAPGEIVGFLGPNGAGKTTTMKVLTGLLHPTAGEVHVGGHVPHKHERTFKRRISLVMGQKSQLIWDVPASETFLVNKVIYEIDDAAYRRQLDELVELLQIAEVMQKPVRQLSLGERMKCELAASLLHKPDLLFLDEPTIGLDVNMQEVVREFIRRYNTLHKATILLTSHYMADVAALCQRVMVINRGKLLYDGEISELIERHAPYKRLKLWFDGEQTAPEALLQESLQKICGSSVKVIKQTEHHVELEVVRQHISAVSAKLLQTLAVADLTIEDPSLEDVISQAFAAGAGVRS